MRQVVVAGPVESTQDHVVRGRPYAAEPVAAVRVVLRVVGRERGYPMGSPEPFGVLQLSDERGDFLLWNHACQEGPEGADGLDVRERSVRKLVVVEVGLIVPQALVDRQGESVTLFTQVRDLLGAAESICHLQEQVCREDLLEARVDPDGVPVVGEALGPPYLPRWSLQEPRLVIHSEIGRASCR